jgi:hypothetical protein
MKDAIFTTRKPWVKDDNSAFLGRRSTAYDDLDSDAMDGRLQTGRDWIDDRYCVN